MAILAGGRLGQDLNDAISLSSDGEDDSQEEISAPPPALNTQAHFVPGLAIDEGLDVLGVNVRAPLPRGQHIEVDGEILFFPDDEIPDLAPRAAAQAPAAQTLAAQSCAGHTPATVEDEANFPYDTCLQRVLEVFPDVCHDHIRKLYDDLGCATSYEALPGPARLENIMEQLLNATSYPRRVKEVKRKRSENDTGEEYRRWERTNRDLPESTMRLPIRAMLKYEFPDIPHHYINETCNKHTHLFQAYIALAEAKDVNDRKPPSERAYRAGHISETNANNTAEYVAAKHGCMVLVEELRSARQRVQSQREDRLIEDAKKRAEQENLRMAMENGETAECKVCFDDIPMNRQIHCDGPSAHFTCFDCAEAYIKSEVGQARCQVLCTADGCGADFNPAQFKTMAPKMTDETLLVTFAKLKQDKDIRDAGLEDLEECPFCDYKAIVPPVEEDFEFRCLNPLCEQISCRKCRQITHVPLTCAQFASDNKLNSRHVVEEAMTAALIRSCNNCKKQFIKLEGCNKMTCPSCQHKQCYVCSDSITNYDHFDQQTHARSRAAAPTGAGAKCPLYDNVEERHDREVKEAEAAAHAQVVKDNPNLSVEDLEVKVSDAVKNAEQAKARARQRHPQMYRVPPAFPAGVDAELQRYAAAAPEPQWLARGRDYRVQALVAQDVQARADARARLMGLRREQFPLHRYDDDAEDDEGFEDDEDEDDDDEDDDEEDDEDDDDDEEQEDAALENLFGNRGPQPVHPLLAAHRAPPPPPGPPPFNVNPHLLAGHNQRILGPQALLNNAFRPPPFPAPHFAGYPGFAEQGGFIPQHVQQHFGAGPQLGLGAYGAQQAGPGAANVFYAPPLRPGVPAHNQPRPNERDPRLARNGYRG